MSRYDGLIIPRSYSEYINKTDAATLLQALQQSGVMDAEPTANSNHPVKSSGLVPVDTIASGNMHSVTSNAVNSAISENTNHLIPMRLSSQITDLVQWQRYLWVGIGLAEKFISFPEISGKTKKVRLIVNVQTDSNNLIIFGAKRQSDAGVVELFRQNVWGGIGDGSFSRQIQVTIDPSFLAPYTDFYFMSDIANAGVAVCYLFAEVYYE